MSLPVGESPVSTGANGGESIQILCEQHCRCVLTGTDMFRVT